MNEMDKVNYKTRREKRLLRRILDKDSHILENMLRVYTASMLSGKAGAMPSLSFRNTSLVS